MAKQTRKSLIAHGDIAVNRKARYEYEILDEFEAGIVLHGSEVKSLRLGLANISEAYAGPKNGRICIHNMRIGEYSNAPQKFQHEPNRMRDLLLHKREIAKLIGAVTRERLTIIPLKLYFNNRGIAKLKLALGKGKKLHDKRQSVKDREWKRKQSRTLRES